LELILRDSKHVQQFMEIASGAGEVDVKGDVTRINDNVVNRVLAKILPGMGDEYEQCGNSEVVFANQGDGARPLNPYIPLASVTSVWPVNKSSAVPEMPSGPQALPRSGALVFNNWGPASVAYIVFFMLAVFLVVL